MSAKLKWLLCVSRNHYSKNFNSHLFKIIDYILSFIVYYWVCSIYLTHFNTLPPGFIPLKIEKRWNRSFERSLSCSNFCVSIFEITPWILENIGKIFFLLFIFKLQILNVLLCLLIRTLSLSTIIASIEQWRSCLVCPWHRQQTIINLDVRDQNEY